MPVTTDVAPHLTASQLNVTLGKTVAASTVGDLQTLFDALNRIPGALLNPSATIASLLP
jgi:hypothetical protein